MSGLVLRQASTAPDGIEDLAIADGRFVDPAALGTDREEVDLDGRPVLPGLADHHVHLFALAAARQSVDLSPEALDAAGGLLRALRAGRSGQPDGWLRGVGYDVSTTGLLDRWALDAAGVGPVRVQDRTGIFWILDSHAVEEVLPLDSRDWPSGVEVAAGVATGVLTRLDHWLGHRVPDRSVDLAGVGRQLASRGITAVTDAGGSNTASDLRAMTAAQLPFRLAAMTRDCDVEPIEGVALGPVKILLDDVDLPSLDDLTRRIGAAHHAGRSVAVHCVTAVQLVLALTAGVGPADRIEHGSLVPDDVLALLAQAGPTVVVQPSLVLTRGDRYLREVDPGELHGLHRLRSFREAGLRIAASTDAPYGPLDPWQAVQAAVGRRTATGAALGPGEALGPLAAVGLFGGHLDDPSRPRTLQIGQPADLVVLDNGWGELGRFPRLRVTMVAGTPTAGTLAS